MYVAPVIVAVLLIVIITLMAVGFVILSRKKPRKGVYSTCTNPMYYDNQGMHLTQSYYMYLNILKLILAIN